MEGEFDRAMTSASEAYHKVCSQLPEVAPYLVTHAHYRRVLAKMNLRECYHLLKLRTSPQAHQSIRDPMLTALELVREVHPTLFEQIRLRG